MSSPGIDARGLLSIYCLCFIFLLFMYLLFYFFEHNSSCMVSRCLDAELILLFIMLAGASARYPSTRPLQCGLPATSCKEAVQTAVCIAGNAFNCFSKICQRTYVRGPCVALPFVCFYLLEIEMNSVMAFEISQSGISTLYWGIPPSIFTGGPRELPGREEMQGGSVWLCCIDLTNVKCPHSVQP